ncbi:MAG: dTDP-4-dehydrorhamnose reductase [Pseudomonadota bacterium]
MPQNILIVGKNGQLARSLERASLPGHPVWLARRELDLAKPEEISAVLQAHKPDIVVNAAAYTAVDAAEDDALTAKAVNADGPKALAECCKLIDATLIHISTDYVFDGTLDQPYTETAPTSPLGVYGTTKLAGEQAIADSGCNYAIVRTAWVYSPFGNNFLKTMLRVAGSRDELNVVADQVGNPTSALDLADAIAAMIASWQKDPACGLNKIYHVAGTNAASWADFAEQIFTFSKAQGGPFAKVNRIPSSQYPTPAARPANSRLSTALFSSTFDFTMPHWQSSTEAVVAELLSAEDD